MINGPHLIVYASEEVHMCVVKALELLGFGSNALHLISVDENFCIKIDELKKTIKNDRENGLTPFCIVGNAGTVNTGAFDNLLELSSIAKEENLWFHVDGAFGSLIILDPQRRYLVKGIEQSDSLAFDFHKWLHCPYDAGCVLIRDGSQLISTFSVHQSYLAHTERGCAGDNPWYCELGIELSRSFRALKVWVTLKEHGFKKLGQKIADNCEQAQYLASLLKKYEDFISVITPTTLNIVNFRFDPKELKKFSDEFIDDFNNELLNDIQLSGIAVASRF
jgi:glutamate/tyrosine decarboxylase-like PLP-dependent enzyme